MARQRYLGKVHKIVKPKRNKRSENIKKVKEVDPVKRKKISARIKFGRAGECIYYKNTYCLLIKNECDPSSIKCKFISDKETKEACSTSQTKNKKLIEGVVLSHNRKCIYEKHKLINVKAIIRVLTSNNKIMEISVPATYCKECNQYILLKSDYKNVKEKGILLCQVIDKTPEYLAKHRSNYIAAESKVHSLGYNVIKQKYNYTFSQRKIILANIIENYEITQHEILSMLDTNIARKINMPNYAEAVEKWKQDREFVANYKQGDIPEVIIKKIIIGKRK